MKKNKSDFLNANDLPITPYEFKQRFPEFSSVPDAIITSWIERSDLFFNKGLWSALYEEGVYYWVAAQVALWREQSSKTNSLLSDEREFEKVGEISFRRAPSVIQESMKDPFLRTLYGQFYRALQKQIGCGSFWV